jgi:NOL1/NOP2/fmu family ribosome biogenesis protein
VDAPCSGSGLFRRDAEAMEEWSEDAVQLCCGRQKRIIADALPALKEEGVLIYSTCSYSQQEDEDIADWLVAELGMENVKLKMEEGWGIIETTSSNAHAAGYRFFPDKVKGEGFYLSCFRKKSSSGQTKLKTARLEKASAKEKSIVSRWLKDGNMEILNYPYLYALPAAFIDDYCVIKHYLNVQYAGVAVGEVMKEKLVPEHALAVNSLLSDAIPVTEVDYDTAIRYLQKQDVYIETSAKGWQAVSYRHHNLGWINALQNRVNNYYPKELRILKQRDDTAFEK